MPHLTIEFSQDLASNDEINAMLAAVHEAAARTGLFEEGHIRVRAIPVAYYRVAGKHEPFIHAQCRIHGGRDAEQKRQLSEAVLAAIRTLGLLTKSTTVEVVDMDKSTYAKYSG